MLAVLNIITGVFADNAVETARMQRDSMVEKERANREVYLVQMRDLFAELDQDRSGTVNLNEFKEHVQDERARCYLQALGIHADDVERLFKLMDCNDSGGIDINEFLEGCLRLKGEARSIDVHTLIQECRRLEGKIDELTVITKESLMSV